MGWILVQLHGIQFLEHLLKKQNKKKNNYNNVEKSSTAASTNSAQMNVTAVT